MDLQLDGKTALVTGSTAGIGLEIARRLKAEGADVVICGRGRAKLDAAVAQTGARGVLADPATAEGAELLVAAVPEVDVLVNNLGIYEAKPFGDITDDDWRRFFDGSRRPQSPRSVRTSRTGRAGSCPTVPAASSASSRSARTAPSDWAGCPPGASVPARTAASRLPIRMARRSIPGLRKATGRSPG